MNAVGALENKFTQLQTEQNNLKNSNTATDGKVSALVTKMDELESRVAALGGNQSGAQAGAKTASEITKDKDSVLWVTMEEGSGTMLYDKSGLGNNGTIKGATWKQLTGGFGYLSFDGIDDFVDCGNPASLDMGTASFTIKLWVFGQMNSTQKSIVNKGREANGYSLFSTSNNKISGILFVGTTWAKYLVSTSVVGYLPDAQWHQIVMAVNRGANTIDIFYDGNEVTYSGDSFASNGFSASDSIDNSKNFGLSNWDNAACGNARGWNTNPWNGGIALLDVVKGRAWGAADALSSFEKRKESLSGNNGTNSVPKT